MRSSATALAFLGLGVLSCSGGETAPKPPTTQPSATAMGPRPNDPPPPKLRLPPGVTPVREVVEIALAPAEDVFHGAIDLEVRLDQPTRFFWLNGAELDVHEAKVTIGAETFPARAVIGPVGYVGFGFDKDLPAGPAHLLVKYDGKISPNDDRGLFRETEDGEPFVFTQFENIDARRAFPCFDEPGFKYKWQLTLKVPKSESVVSNTPVEASSDEGANKVFRFIETKPLPAYLVAFAVGPFAFVDGGQSKSGAKVRVVVPKGRVTETEYAAKNTALIIDDLEGYFGIKYPYEKMDVVPVPHLVSFGAMENAGMITIGMGLALARKGEDTVQFKRDYIDVMGHELAHQWFGDLVTTAWWDDIWLNEGFATWMERKVVRSMHPEWHFEFNALADTERAMAEDSLVSSRKIRQEIESEDDIQNAFDTITYEKGAAVLATFERYLGEAAFRKGIKTYLEAHAFGVATSADFLRDLSRGAGKDVAAAFSTFLDKPGLPIIRAKADCAGKEGKITFEQERYFPIGSKGSKEASWRIPICASNEGGESCAMIGGADKTLALGGACPKQLLLNPGGAGYYRVAYEGSELAKLLGKGTTLSAIDRVDVAGEIGALAWGGRLDVADALGRLTDVAADADYHVRAVGTRIAGVAPDEFMTAAERAKMAKILDVAYGARARQLGWRPRASDTQDDPLERASIVAWFADRTDDRELVKQAKELAGKWLDDEKSIESVAAPNILFAAVEHGDRALFDRLVVEAKKTKDDNRRGTILNALSAFRDPALAVEAMKIGLGDAFDIREAAGLLLNGGDFRTEGARFGFIKENFDAILAKMPMEARPEIMRAVGGFCDAKLRDDAAKFYGERASKIVGGPRRLAQALESADLCIAARAELSHQISLFLATRR